MRIKRRTKSRVEKKGEWIERRTWKINIMRTTRVERVTIEMEEDEEDE